jgi:PAS domain-containing protein
MTNTVDPVPYWTRQVAHLRAQAVKRARTGAAPCGEVTDAALETCDGLLRDLAGARLECGRLHADVRRSDAAWDHLFEILPSACILTDAAGLILKANRAAGALLSLNPRRLKDRELVVFSEDREAFSALLHRVGRGTDGELRATVTFRPRERKPAAVEVLVIPLTDQPDLRLWFLTPAGAAQTSAPFITSPDESASAVI